MHKLTNFLFNFLYKIRFVKRPTKTTLSYNLFPDNYPNSFGDNIIHSLEEGNIKIKNLIESGKPCMICRFGSTELSVIYQYYIRDGKYRHLVWDDNIKLEINKQSGFFPTSDKMISRFCKEFITCLTDIDFLGVWLKPGEDVMVNEFTKNAFLAPLKSIEPYYFDAPWSKALEGKKVLVIHPFAESIKNQYKNHLKLFRNTVLPNFGIEVMEAQQTLGTSTKKFDNWFDSLKYMCNEIEKKDFDVAIIGAGAYGLPLAAFVKRIGKQAIHMGGATQIMFGIKGKRWDNIPEVSNLYNEYWVRPLEGETPAKENQLEDGCYW
jgi:hypothetical protein